jgi:hypothetical protein
MTARRLGFANGLLCAVLPALAAAIVFGGPAPHLTLTPIPIPGAATAGETCVRDDDLFDFCAGVDATQVNDLRDPGHDFTLDPATGEVSLLEP